MESSTAPAVKVTIEYSLSDRTEFTFTDRFRIGRHPHCQLPVNHQEVSRYHADVFTEDGRWWIQDLQSTNGVFIEDRKIDKLPLSGTIRIRLGNSGPRLLFELERAAQLEPAAAPSHTLRDYIQHYFSKTAEGKVGRHTMMVRRAYAEVRKKQRWMYISIISIVAVLLALTGGYAVYKHRQVRLQRKLAADIFYNMKSLELELAMVIKETEQRRTPGSKKQIEAVRAKQGQLEKSYNQFVDTLDVYGKALSEEERIILHIARRFGESEINMPGGFVKEVKTYIAKWKSTGRLERAIKRARSRGYIPKIVQTLSAHDLPPQFFYLALQESNLNLKACGPQTQFGIAKGMWQFIPTTALKYGLKTGPLVNEPIPDLRDDRHHFGKSTLAAAKYLRDIYTTDAQASGLLVMASYNWGERQVIELIQSMPQNPRDRNFWRLTSKYRRRIPKETYDYVFSIFSAAVIGENPRLFGFDFDNPLASEEIAYLNAK
jgi:hypothetical protein